MADKDKISVTNLSPQQRVAVLLIALGEDTAAEIVRYLSDDETERIAQSIAEMQSVSAELIDEVLEDFEQLLRSGHGLDTGGEETARSILQLALGDERANETMSNIAAKKSRGFYMLRHSEPEELAHVLAKEQPQIIAVVLAQLEPVQAAAVFDRLPADKQADVAYRMANLQDISPQALDELERSLASELKEIVSGPTTLVGGAQAVADMLGRASRSTESTILDRLEVLDPEVAEGIRNRMVTFDSLTDMTTTQIQSVLKQTEGKDLPLAMKGASDQTASVVYGAMSKRAGAQLKEEVEFLGRTRQSEVDEAQVRIAQTIRQLETEGAVTLARAGDDDEYV
jgi:flagellar motor switch protein FliG